MRSQLLCLTAYVDQDVATRAVYLSAALSRAATTTPTELAPTASELTRWLNETTDLLSAFAIVRGREKTAAALSRCRAPRRCLCC
jgi:hypothetical protein